jgi:hypothetical protein
MSAAEVARRKNLYAHARERRSGQGEAFARLQAALHDELRFELLMRKARADLKAAQDRVMRDCKTLRETLAMGMGALS